MPSRLLRPLSHPVVSRSVLRQVLAALCIAGSLLMAGRPAVAGEGILDVLDRSQSLRLAQLAPVDPSDARARVLQASFQQVLSVADGLGARPVSLLVVQGPVVAETFHGRIIVVNADVAARPEGERLFVLAHELGHVVHADWAAVGSVYQRHIPAEVLQSRTDAVAALLGREMSALSHEQELSADGYALQLIGRLGHGMEAAVATFTRYGVQVDSATHPGTRKRIAALRLSAP